MNDEVSYRHTEEMGQISGFGGKDDAGQGYEDCCQDMLHAGVVWLKAHPDADLLMAQDPNITGLFESRTPETEELEKAVLEGSRGQPDENGETHLEATGAQMHNVMNRLFYIAGHGWDRYVAQVIKYQQEGDGGNGNAA